MQSNRRCKVVARPTGIPTTDDFGFDAVPVEPPTGGQVLVQVSHVSVDPAMRGWMSNLASYLPPVELGDVMPALGAGVVVQSSDERLKEGMLVSGFMGVQDYALVDAAALTVLDAALAPPEVHLGRLGMPALTAYFGLMDVGRAKAGDTVVVSGAAGAVGTVVGQLAKLMGCRVVGIAGGPDKCTFITEELGFDAAIDYKAEDVVAALHKHCPDGIDVYFDNVGGDVLDAALTRLSLGARVVICGAISLYAAAELKGPRYYLALLTQRATMTGFLVFDFAERFPEAQAELARWYAAGELTAQEHVVEGLESFPDCLRMLFEGGNTGKLVLALG